MHSQHPAAPPAVQRDAARCVANRNAKALLASFNLRVADGKRAAARVRSAASAPASAWLMATPGAHVLVELSLIHI